MRDLIKLCLLILVFTVTASAQDWPRYRGDAGLTGRITLKQPGLQPPVNFKSFELGGGAIQPLVTDLDGDSRADLIFLRQGRLVAMRQDGTTLINGFYAATELVAVTDLDGDGSPAEIIIINAARQQLLAIDAAGTLRWQHQFPEFVTLQAIYVKIADIAPERPGKEVVVFPDHTKTEQDARGYFFTSAGALYSSPLVPNMAGGQLNFPQLAIGDIEGDGPVEVVVVGRPRLMIYASSGELKQQLEFREGDPEGRHYGLFALADVNGDSKLEAVVIADEIPALSNNDKAAAITVLQLTPTIKRLWGTSFPGQTLQAPLNAVTDLDGDGRSEIVVNVFTGGSQQVRVYRGEGDSVTPGQPQILAILRDLFVWDVRDMNKDGRPELLTSSEVAEQPSLSLSSQLKVFRLAANAGNTFMFLDAVKPVTGMYALVRTPMAMEEFLRIGSSSNSRMRQLVVDGTRPRFITYSKNSTGGTNLQERSVIVKPTKFRIKTELDTLRPGPVRAVLTGADEGESFLINREVDGLITSELVIYVRRNEKLRVNTSAPIFTGASFSTEPRVADLDEDGRNEILVRGPSGRIILLAFDERDGNLSQVGQLPGTQAPIIEALDGSNGRPQIITVVSDQGRLRLVVYDTRGSVANGELRAIERWGRTFDDIAAGTNIEITTGRFSGLPNRVDIFLATPRGRSLALSGLDGTTLWARDNVFTFGNHASVRDFNRDGRDDLYIVSDNLYRIIDGGRGTDIIGPINVSGIGADFNSTPLLSGTNETLMIGAGTVVKMLDMGRPVWNFSKTLNGKIARRQNSEILMGLAELGNGGSFDRIGGNFGEGDTFYVYDYATGLLSYKTAYQPQTEIITVDIDNDGKDEFLFGTTDGQIVALRALDGSLLWSVKADAFPNNPIIAGMGKDKVPSLIFAPGDGTVRLYRLD